MSIYFALQAGLFYALATWLVARYHGGLQPAAEQCVLQWLHADRPAERLRHALAGAAPEQRHRIMATCGVLATLCLALIALRPGWQPLVVCMLLGVALNGTFSWR